MILSVDTRSPLSPRPLTDEGYRTGSPNPSSPFKDFSFRYPPPDPLDPFAPLSALRSRRSTLQGIPPPEPISFDTVVRKTPVQNKHASIDIVSFKSPQDPTATKAARHTLKSYVRHEFPITEKVPEKDPPVVHKNILDRRRSLSTPTPVSPLLLPSTTLPSPQKQHFDVERRRPATASGVRLTTIHSMVDDSTDANTSNTEITLISESPAPPPPQEEPIGKLRYRGSRTQFPFLATEVPSPPPASKRINFPKFLMSKKSQASFASTLVNTANEGKTSTASTPLSRSIAPSLHESESISPMTPESQFNTPSQVTNETLPSLVSSKSFSSSSSESSTFVFNAISPSPAPDVATTMYKQGRKSMSNPRLTSNAFMGPVPPTASPITRPHTSSGLPPRSRPFDPSLGGLNDTPALPFGVSTPPTLDQLAKAASIDVIAESGVRVPFGRLFMGQKTIVCFIRHFWCSFCQDYMFSITKNIDPRVLRQARVNLVIISNGSYHMIKPYRHIFGMPFPVYTDPSLKLYDAMGMTKRSMDAGPDSKRGSYVRHGILSGFAMVLVNAFKHGMPFFEKGGDMAQLGGEFVLGPGLTSSYTHRMTTTRSHSSILRVLKAAVDISETVNLTPSQETEMTEAERAKWMKERRKKLEQLRDRKSFRRGGEKWCERDSCEMALGPSTENVSVTVHSHAEPVSPVVVQKVTMTYASLNGSQPIAEKTLKTRKSNLDAKKLRYMKVRGK